MLNEFLEKSGYDPEKVLAVTLGTDGLNVANNKLISVGLKSNSIDEVLFIQGGNAAATAPYTGISEEEYFDLAETVESVYDQVQAIVESHSLLVTYNVSGFFFPWWSKLANQDGQSIPVEVLDVVAIAKAKRAGTWELPAKPCSVEQLQHRLTGSVIGVKGVSFKGLAMELAPDLEDWDVADLRKKPHQLYRVWQALSV